MRYCPREMTKTAFAPLALLSLLIVGALSCNSEPPGPAGPESIRKLGLAHQSEIDVSIFEDGQPIGSSSGYAVLISEAPGRTSYEGHQANRIVTESSGPDQAGIGGCFVCAPNEMKYVDGFEGIAPESGEGRTWNGVYVLSAVASDATCEKTLSVNHSDSDGDEYFDATAADQQFSY